MFVLTLAAIDLLGSGASLAAIVSVAVVVAAGIGTFIRTYVRNQKLAGTMAAKDEVIRTNAQTIEAFEDRISTLETKLNDIQEELLAERRLNQDLQKRVSELEEYTAPVAIPQLQIMFREQEKLLTVVSTKLGSVEKLMLAGQSHDANEIGG